MTEDGSFVAKGLSGNWVILPSVIGTSGIMTALYY